MRRIILSVCLAATILAGPVTAPAEACPWNWSSRSSKTEQTDKPATPVRDAAKVAGGIVVAPFRAAALLGAITVAGVRGRIESLRERVADNGR